SKNAQGQYVNPKEDISSIQIPGLNQTRITPSLKQTFERSAYLDNIFPTLLANEPTAVALYYTEPEAAATRYYPNIGLGEIVPADYTPFNDVFYPPVTPQNDPTKATKWTATYDDPAGNGLMITNMNPVYGKKGNFLGAVCMDVQLSKIAINIENYT